MGLRESSFQLNKTCLPLSSSCYSVREYSVLPPSDEHAFSSSHLEFTYDTSYVPGPGQTATGRSWISAVHNDIHWRVVCSRSLPGNLYHGSIMPFAGA